ncbi:MAG: pseudouridine synthase [Legionellales bacterium]|nr:pseudouridine synthase [Legionellales bacterium]|tara:strand:- start:4 stop:549 length:546 start_codon:yes stop_codon:yes gene_type:complete
MPKIILFNKPYEVLCQFTDQSQRETLADYIKLPDIYPAGRLDYQSEGLLILTDNGILQHKISHPKFDKAKTYWVQVEGIPCESALKSLKNGVKLNDGWTRPAKVQYLAPPLNLWPRNPPVRFRANIPTSWLSITLTEGRNRQVRRMTAHVGHPTLRLIRMQIGEWQLGHLQPGEWKILSVR